MAAKIAAFLITFLINIAVGVVILFTMLIAMNGYSESDSMWGLGVFVLLALAVAILSGAGAVLFLNLMQKKQFSTVKSIVIGIVAFFVVGLALEVVSSFLGVGVAEFVRVNF